MKKIILAFFFSLMMLSSFAEISISKLSKKIEDTGCFVIAETQDAGSEDKYPVKVVCETNDEFLVHKMFHFFDTDTITLEDVKSELKKGTDVLYPQYQGKSFFRWIQRKYFSFSVMYWQSVGSRPVNSAGNYIFWVFDTDKVYTIVLWDIPRPCPYIRNEDFDAMSDYFSFKEGQMADPQRGLEQVQGYVCTEESVARFYEALLAEDPSLPESVLRFQRAANLLEQIISQL